MLQALKEDPPLNTKCKDKFLIQSTIITPEKEALPVQAIVCFLIPSHIGLYVSSLKPSGLAPMLTMKEKSTNRNSVLPIYLLKVKRWKRKMKIL
jgi:hypothetical protein